jgi:hypothetical protein
LLDSVINLVALQFQFCLQRHDPAALRVRLHLAAFGARDKRDKTWLKANTQS